MADDQVIQDLRTVYEELREKCRNETQTVRKNPETERAFRLMYFGMKELNYRQSDLTRVHKIGDSVVQPREVDNMRIFLRRNHLSRTDTMKCLTDVLGDVSIVYLDERQEWTKRSVDQHAAHPEVMPGEYQVNSFNFAQLVEGTLYGPNACQNHFVDNVDIGPGSLTPEEQPVRVPMAQSSIGHMSAHSNNDTPNIEKAAGALPSFGMQSTLVEQWNFVENAVHGQPQSPLYHWRENGWHWPCDSDLWIGDLMAYDSTIQQCEG